MICDNDMSCVYKEIIPPWGTALHRLCVQTRGLHMLPSGSETARLYKWLRGSPHSHWPDESQILSLQNKRVELKQKSVSVQYLLCL